MVYDTWSLTLREECRHRVFENSMLRRIYGPRLDEVTGEWRRLYNGTLSAVCSHQILLGRSNEEE